MISVNTKAVWNGKVVSKDIFNATNRGVDKGALLVHGKAVKLAPKDTGNLQNSITIALVGDSKDFPQVSNSQLVNGRTIKAGKNEAIVGTIVIYATVQEFGLGNQKRAQAFMQPAFNNSVDQIKKFISQEVMNVKWVN